MKSSNDNKYEIVKFKLNELEMDIFVSIEEEMVWLTRIKFHYCLKRVNPPYLDILETYF